MQDQLERARRSVVRLRDNLLDAVEREPVLAARHHAEVHAAIDLLRVSQADRQTLQRAEDISCLLHMMPDFLRQGRINAYASARLRLRSAARELGSVGAW